MARTSKSTSALSPNEKLLKSASFSDCGARDTSDECGISKLSPAALGLLADFFKILSESSRLQIVCSLKPGPKNVTEIIESTGLGQANVSKHLKMLAQAGVVSRQQQGVCVYYEISNPFIFELCDLVCNALSSQIQQQTQHLQSLGAIRQT